MLRDSVEEFEDHFLAQEVKIDKDNLVDSSTNAQ